MTDIITRTAEAIYNASALDYKSHCEQCVAQAHAALRDAGLSFEVKEGGVMGHGYDCPECGHEKCVSTCKNCPDFRKANGMTTNTEHEREASYKFLRLNPENGVVYWQYADGSHRALNQADVMAINRIREAKPDAARASDARVSGGTNDTMDELQAETERLGLYPRQEKQPAPPAKQSDDVIERAKSSLEYLAIAAPPSNDTMQAVRNIRAALSAAGVKFGGE